MYNLAPIGPVRRGDKVGNQSNQGFNKVYHLHMEVWQGPQGVIRRIDPALCLSLTEENKRKDLSFKRAKQHLKAKVNSHGY